MSSPLLKILFPIVIFIAAGICEIAGGYFIWLWVKDQRHWSYLIGGSVLLVLYAIIATLQAASFGRVYAAYGGVFIAMSLYWGWKIDGIKPDIYDMIGGMTCLIGVAIILFAPRN